MARGRFVSKVISLDEKVDALSNDTARLLFTWLITHLDCEGRMHGDARTVKSVVFPRREMPVVKIEKYLKEMENFGLIFRYFVNGNQYLCMKTFEKHQPGLRKDRETQSQIPLYTPELLPSKSSNSPAQVKVKVKVKDKVKDTPKGVQHKEKDSVIPMIFTEMRSYLGYEEDKDSHDPIPNYGKEGKAIKRMLARGFTDKEILDCWKRKISQRGGEFVSMTWVNEDIGKKQLGTPRSQPSNLSTAEEIAQSIKEAGQ